MANNSHKLRHKLRVASCTHCRTSSFLRTGDVSTLSGRSDMMRCNTSAHCASPSVQLPTVLNLVPATWRQNATITTKLRVACATSAKRASPPAWLSLLCLCFPVPSCMVTAVPVRCVTPRGKTFQTRDAVREASSIISPGPRQEPKRPGLGPREHKSGHYGNVGRSQRNAMSAAVDCVAGGQPPPETGLGSRERPTKTAPLMATRLQAERDQVFIGRNRWEQLQGELTPGPRQQAKHVMNQNSGLQEAAPVDPVVLCVSVSLYVSVCSLCVPIPLHVCMCT